MDRRYNFNLSEASAASSQFSLDMRIISLTSTICDLKRDSTLQVRNK